MITNKVLCWFLLKGVSFLERGMCLGIYLFERLCSFSSLGLFSGSPVFRDPQVALNCFLASLPCCHASEVMSLDGSGEAPWEVPLDVGLSRFEPLSRHSLANVGNGSLDRLNLGVSRL